MAKTGDVACRDIFNDPERLRRMLAPDSVQAMMGLRQNMDQLQQLLGGDGRGGPPGNKIALPLLPRHPGKIGKHFVI